VNWRAIGCGTLAIAAFVLLGIWGIWRATAPPACPDRLPSSPAAYQPAGEVGDRPALEGVDGDLVQGGSTSFGLASWVVWVEPGGAPAASSDPLPPRIVLECGGGFRPYQRDTR